MKLCKPLFKYAFKSNWMLLLLFGLILLMYLSVMVSMYDVSGVDTLSKAMEMMPKAVLKAFSMDSIATNLTSYLAGYLYGMLMFAFPLVYIILVINKLINKKIDNGSFAYLLSTPNSRESIIFTQGMYIVVSMFVLFGIVTLFGITLCQSMFPGEINIYNFIKLNVVTMFAHIAVAMISFFFACLFNENKYAVGFCAGVPIILLLINMLSGVSENLSFLKYVSLYGIYSPSEVADGAGILVYVGIYLLISIVMYVSGILVFMRKNISL